VTGQLIAGWLQMDQAAFAEVGQQYLFPFHCRGHPFGPAISRSGSGAHFEIKVVCAGVMGRGEDRGGCSLEQQTCEDSPSPV